MSKPTKNQDRLVNESDGIFIVDAGPGTGKTTTVVARYISMLKKGIPPQNILIGGCTTDDAKRTVLPPRSAKPPRFFLNAETRRNAEVPSSASRQPA